MEIKVRAVEGTDNKSKAQIEEQLLEKHADSLETEEKTVVEAEKISIPQDTSEDTPKEETTEEQEKTPSSELNDENVLSFLKNRYNKEINSVDELFAEKEANEPLPEDVSAYLKYKQETGRGISDFYNLQKDYNTMDDDALLADYVAVNEEGLDAIRDVIYNLETYDITTIRASTPMYLMARVIKSMGIKMVLSGEGADELFGGYLYFHKAPNAQEFHEETVRKLSKLHMYDCLRANKSLAAWGIEGRVPFLDKEFMDVAMSINPQDKMINGERMEKWVVRKAFEDMIPESVAWRQKEQFSDGVGYSWIDTLKEMVNDLITDEQMANAHFRFPIQTPQNKEEFYYRSIFEEHFPSDAAALCVPQEPSVACSTKIALEWDEAFKDMNDPSGRAVAKVHDDAYQEKEAVAV
jgi:hypothetical protein